MKITYYPESDSLYIDLSEKSSVESRKILEGIGLDYDEAGNLVGIDIDNASSIVQLKELILRENYRQISRQWPKSGFCRPF